MSDWTPKTQYSVQSRAYTRFLCSTYNIFTLCFFLRAPELIPLNYCKFESHNSPLCNFFESNSPTGHHKITQSPPTRNLMI